MALTETESLVLKSYNLAEADRIVVLLTRDHGVVRGVAKGAKRLKSKFGSGLEPFSVVRASYFEKEGQELVSIQRVDLVQSNFTAASNPDFLQKFSYLCELLITFSPPKDPNETLYRMVKACIETAAAQSEMLLGTGVYFEMWLLKLAGYLPDWTRCDQCKRTFEEQEEGVLRTDFHFICAECNRSSPNRVIREAERSIAMSALKLSPLAFSTNTLDRSAELNKLTGMLKALISRSIGKEIAGEKSLAIRQTSQ
jgi:DNA repair protein RecO (recombination protein O)